MSVKHTNRELEKLALRLICEDKQGSQFLLGSISEAHFGNAALKDVFKRISSIAKNRSMIITWPEILIDSAIPEPVRDNLRGFNQFIEASLPNGRRILGELEKYRKLRALYNTTKLVAEAFENDKVDDVDKLLDSVTEQLTLAKSRNNETRLFHVGMGNNASKIISTILYEDNSKTFIPTGFKTFDTVNRGIFRSSLFTIAATSGGGKTALALQLQHNFSSAGAKTCLVSLEMNEVEMMRRNLSNWADVDMSEMIKGSEMIPQYKKKVIDAYKAKVMELKNKGTRQSIYTPDEDVRIEDIMLTIRPYNYDVVIIDYISLLKGVDDEDQWKKLSSIARYGKVYANSTNSIVILLAQLSDSGAIRYSKGIQEHSSNFWGWIYDQKAKETGTIYVNQYKARNQKAFSFYLKEDFSKMSIRDLTDDEIQNYSTITQSPSSEPVKTRNGKPQMLPHQKRAYQTHTRNNISSDDNYLEGKLGNRL